MKTKQHLWTPESGWRSPPENGLAPQLVKDLAANSHDAEIASSIILIAHNLELRVIAEGVENEDQLAFLRRRGCDEMQGFIFSRPVAADAFEEMLTSGKLLRTHQAV